MVVPTLDEAPTIDKVITGVRDAGVDVLVVDDGSRDGTREIVQERAALDPGIVLIDRGRKMGLGSAYTEGFRWGLERGYERFGEMDGDLSHDPADLPHLLAGARMADLAIGSRYVAGGGVAEWPLHRRLLSRGGNLYVRLLTGLPVRDATAGYRLYRREVLEAIDLASIRSDGYAFQIEMALRTWRLGFDILEVPVTFTERTEGASKMSRAIIAEALWRVPRWALSGPRRPAPRRSE